MASTTRGDRVVVVGGGIGGLTAGYRLKEAGFDVLVLEVNDSVGGRMSTIEKGAYLIDIGASILIHSYRSMAKLLDDTGLRAMTVSTDDTIGFKRDGKIHHFRNHSLADMARSRMMPLRTKLKTAPMAWDILRQGSKLSWSDPARAADLDRENVREYLARRIGSADLTDNLITPILLGMALVGPEDQSAVDLLSYFRNVFLSKFFNCPEGIQFLPDGLARQLTVETNARVTGIEESAGEVRVSWSRPGEPDRTERAAGCVIAVQAPDIPGIFPQLLPDQHEVVQSVRYAAGLGVHFGLTRATPDPSSLLYQTPDENPDFHLAIVEHNKGPGRTPPGHGLIATYWRQPWGRERWDWSDEDVVASALPGFSKLFPGAENDIDMTHVQRWPHALLYAPQGRYTSLAKFAAATDPRSRIRFAGDWLAASSTNSAIATGERAAQQLIATLSSVSTVHQETP